jgi:hypothetical protein
MHKILFIYIIDRAEADISQNLTISIFLGTVEINFIQIMCEKIDRSTPEVSVFGSENSVHPW